MKGRVMGGVGRSLVVAWALALAATGAVSAQDRQCRCVGPEGEPLEDCVCVRTPRLDRIVVAPFGPGSERPRLGVSVEVGDPSEHPEGARISGVLEDGPADRAGLREGDVLTHLDGRSLLTPLSDERERGLDPDRALPAQRLLALARELEPGERVEVQYLRDGEARRVTVEAQELDGWPGVLAPRAPGWDSEAFGQRMRELSERMRSMRAPDAPGAPDAPAGPFQFRFEGPEGRGMALFRSGPGSVAGLELVAVNPELGGYFGTDRGVLVVSVEGGDGLGLRAGDVILEIDGRVVEAPARVRQILASYDEGEAVAFRLRREGREMDVSGRIGG